MSELILKDGKFLLDGVEIPPRIGDAEQIDLLKRSERYGKYLENEGFNVSFDVNLRSLEAICQFRCICGRNINYSFQKYVEMYDIYSFDISGGIAVCPQCGRTYEFNFGLAKLLK